MDNTVPVTCIHLEICNWLYVEYGSMKIVEYARIAFGSVVSAISCNKCSSRRAAGRRSTSGCNELDLTQVQGVPVQ